MPKRKQANLYSTEELEELALEAIKREGLVFIDEIDHYLPCERSTIYTRGLNKSNKIRKALFKNKVTKKKGLRDRWYERESTPVTEIALYRLLATNEERASLAQKEYIVKDQDNSELMISSKALERIGQSKKGRELLSQLAGMLSEDE